MPEKFENRVGRRNRQVLEEEAIFQAVEGKTFTKLGAVKYGQYTVTHTEYEEEPTNLVLAQGITEKKKHARRIRTFKQAMVNVGHAIYWIDDEGTIEYINRDLEDFTG